MQRYGKNLNPAIGLRIFFTNNYQNIAFQRIKNSRKIEKRKLDDFSIISLREEAYILIENQFHNLFISVTLFSKLDRVLLRFFYL